MLVKECPDGGNAAAELLGEWMQFRFYADKLIDFFVKQKYLPYACQFANKYVPGRAGRLAAPSLNYGLIVISTMLMNRMYCL
jgi:hypothetical protein